MAAGQQRGRHKCSLPGGACLPGACPAVSRGMPAGCAAWLGCALPALCNHGKAAPLVSAGTNDCAPCFPAMQEQLQQSSAVIAELRRELRAQGSTTQARRRCLALRCAALHCISLLGAALGARRPAAERRRRRRSGLHASSTGGMWLVNAGWVVRGGGSPSCLLGGSIWCGAALRASPLCPGSVVLQRLQAESEGFAALKEAYDAMVRQLEDSQGTVARQQVRRRGHTMGRAARAALRVAGQGACSERVRGWGAACTAGSMHSLHAPQLPPCKCHEVIMLRALPAAAPAAGRAGPARDAAG